jgi:hypothetical protein
MAKIKKNKKVLSFFIKKIGKKQDFGEAKILLFIILFFIF